MQLRKPLFNVCLKSENETQSWYWDMCIYGVIVPAVFWMVSPLSFLVLEFYSGPSICKPLWSFREIFCTPVAHSMFLCTFLKDRETGAALEIQDHHIPPGNSLTSECIIIPILLKALDLSRKLPAGWVSELAIEWTWLSLIYSLVPLLQSERQGEISVCISCSCTN